jgi:hypothetical protein
MGIVYEAEQQHPKRRVALNVVPRHSDGTTSPPPSTATRFARSSMVAKVP